MKLKRNPTKFRAEEWCDGTWAVIMLDGDEAQQPCAFGSEQSMSSYAARLNECKGILCGAVTVNDP